MMLDLTNPASYEYYLMFFYIPKNIFGALQK